MIRDLFYSVIHFFNYHSMWLIMAVVVSFVIGWGFLEFVLRRHTKLYTVVNAVFFLLALFFILSITLLFRGSDDFQRVSLIPFDIIGDAIKNQIFLKSMVMNTVLFIPLSLFGCSLFRCRSSKRMGMIFIVSGIGLSLLIEILQYLLALGQADVDDVICNTIGLLIGYLLYRLHDRYIMKSKGNKT